MIIKTQLQKKRNQKSSKISALLSGAVKTKEEHTIRQLGLK